MVGLPSLAMAQSWNIRFQLSWFANESATGEIVADKKGYFQDKGLSVEIAPGGPSVNAIQDVLGRQADIAVAYAPQIMYAANNGLPIKCFAAVYQKAPLTFFFR